jgi:hypothetical protein
MVCCSLPIAQLYGRDAMLTGWTDPIARRLATAITDHLIGFLPWSTLEAQTQLATDLHELTNIICNNNPRVLRFSSHQRPHRIHGTDQFQQALRQAEHGRALDYNIVLSGAAWLQLLTIVERGYLTIVERGYGVVTTTPLTTDLSSSTVPSMVIITTQPVWPVTTPIPLDQNDDALAQDPDGAPADLMSRNVHSMIPPTLVNPQPASSFNVNTTATTHYAPTATFTSTTNLGAPTTAFTTQQAHRSPSPMQLAATAVTAAAAHAAHLVGPTFKKLTQMVQRCGTQTVAAHTKASTFERNTAVNASIPITEDAIEFFASQDILDRLSPHPSVLKQVQTVLDNDDDSQDDPLPPVEHPPSYDMAAHFLTIQAKAKAAAAASTVPTNGPVCPTAVCNSATAMSARAFANARALASAAAINHYTTPSGPLVLPTSNPVHTASSVVPQLSVPQRFNHLVYSKTLTWLSLLDAPRSIL